MTQRQHSSCGLGDVLTMKHCHWRCVHYLQTRSSIQYLWQAMDWYRQKTNVHLLSSCLHLYNSYVLSAHRVSNVTELDNFECYVHTVDRLSEYLWASKALFPYNMYMRKIIIIITLISPNMLENKAFFPFHVLRSKTNTVQYCRN